MRWTWFWVALLVAVAAGASVAWFTGQQAEPSPPAASSGQAQAAVRPAGQAQLVAAALRSLPSSPQSLVASGAQSQVGGRARQAIPAGTVVTPDAKSWAPDGVGGGTMLVTIAVPGHAPVTYDAIMVSEDGQWKVLATILVGNAPSAAGTAP